MSPEAIERRKAYGKRPEVLARRRARYAAKSKEERQAIAKNAYQKKAEARRAYARQHRLENPPSPEQRRLNNRKRRGIVDATGEPPHVGVCEICKLERMLYMDHDHKTGFVRGWLCTPCNRQLGYWENKLDAAQDYLYRARLQFVARNEAASGGQE